MKNPSAKSAAAQTDRFITGCGFFVFAAAAIWTVFFVPMNMDEAGIYHVLDCLAYPFAPLHTFREACSQQNDLMTPLGLTIREPGFYTGLWPSILYAPFYFLFHAPGAQYAFGLIFLLAFAALAARMTGKPLLSFALILSFFPFVYQFVHDTGPVKYALLLFPLSAIFLKRIMQAPPPVRYGWAVVWPLLLVGAVEEKPFFLYLLPSIIFFALALAEEESLNGLFAALKKSRLALLVAAGLFVSGLALLLLSVNAHGWRYIGWLVSLSHKNAPLSGWDNAFTNFTLYWPAYAHYTYNLIDNRVSVILIKVVTLIFLLTGAVVLVALTDARSYPRLRLSFLVLSFASSAFLFLAVGNTWAGHHFIFLWAPLIVLIADLIGGLAPGPALGMAAAFFILNLWSVAALTQETPLTGSAGEREAVFHFFDDDARATGAIINFSSWGGYYIQSLYGPENQLVTYTEPYDEQLRNNVPVMPEDAKKLLTLAQKTKRTIYDVCFGLTCNKAALESAFGGAVSFEDALPGLQNWHVFVATPRPSR